MSKKKKKNGSFSSFFQQIFSFFADARRKEGFQPVKNLFFGVGQQKKKELLEKEPVKITALLGYVNRLGVCTEFIDCFERHCLNYLFCIAELQFLLIKTKLVYHTRELQNVAVKYHFNPGNLMVCRVFHY